MPFGPDPKTPHPMAGFPQVGFLKPLIKNPLIEVGEYTYYDDPDGPEHFEQRCVLYHFPFVGDRLIIGKFCAIARGVRFIMNGANHSMEGYSTYPFHIFANGWEASEPPPTDPPHKGDTIIGNDVWIGYDSVILSGIRIGDGAVIGACSVVTRDVEPYAIVGGNPACLIRKRFDEATIAHLLSIRWWDWPAEKITQHAMAIASGDRAWLESQSGG
jgi:virginiamycin A acetyltransferase